MKILRFCLYFLLFHFIAAGQDFSNTFKIDDFISYPVKVSEIQLIPEVNYSFERIISEDFNISFLYKNFQKSDNAFLYNPFKKYSFHNKNDYFSFRAEPEYSFFSLGVHLKPVLKMDKTDIYVFGNFSLSEKKILIGKSVYTIPEKRDLYWEAGFGISYEFKEDYKSFFEYSRQFINQKLISTPKFGIDPGYYKAGIKYKF